MKGAGAYGAAAGGLMEPPLPSADGTLNEAPGAAAAAW